MKETIGQKSFKFAVRVVQLAQSLMKKDREFVLSKQFLRSGTAIGALLREAQNAESKKDFIHKMSISLKECDETIYWLELLHATNYINQTTFEEMKTENIQILKMLKRSIITARSNMRYRG